MLKPTGLVVGNQFRLLFLTHTGHSPTSSEIADYNTYVQSQANASNAHPAIKHYSSGFTVVGSTEDDDARDNTMTTGTGVPIYWLNGNKVADNYADFYDGSWDDEANPTRRGGDVSFPTNGNVWTGSSDHGTAFIGMDAMGDHTSHALGESLITFAGLNHDPGGPLNSGSLSAPNNILPYYALSPIFTVGNTPATGAPTVTGTPRVGEQLTAATTDIEDDNGLTTPNYTYQWVRVGETDETDISGATNSTYTLKPEDADKEIKVKVTFTDDLSYTEGPLESLPTIRVAGTDVLVRNTEQSSDGTARPLTSDVSNRAQAFTTGANAAGYGLSSIGVVFDTIEDTSTAGDHLTVTLNADTSGEPGNALCTLTDPTNFSASGRHTFNVPTTGTESCPTLAASTTYFAVIERVINTADMITLEVTTSSDEDNGSLAGWSISNDRHFTGNSPLGTQWNDTTSAHQIEIKGEEAVAKPQSISLTSDPNDDMRTGDDNTYAIGDTVKATVTFSAAVDITDSPQLTLLFGSSEKNATCTAATNTTTVVCSYEVAQNDNAPDGVGIKANSLALNGGAIRIAGSTTVNADLSHAAVAVNSQHKVDGIRPTLITTGPDAPKTSADGTQVFLRFSEALSSTDFTAFNVVILTSGTSITSAPTSVTINNGDRVTVTHTGVVGATSTLTLSIIQSAVTDLVGNTSSQRTLTPIINNARAPVAPTDLTAIAASTTRIDLAWSAPPDDGAADVTGYKIEVSVDAGNNWTDLVADTNSTDTRYAHTGLTPNDTRHYRVSAINPISTGPVSNVVSATTLAVQLTVQSGSGTLFVANTAGGNNQDLVITPSTTRRAQAFTTGPASAGYVLSSIGIRFSQIVSPSTAARDLEVTLNEEASGGNPGGSLCTLIDPSAFDDHAVNIFTTPTTGENTCPILQASTTYFVVVKRVDGLASQFFKLTGTTRDAEDSPATKRGWSIADQSRSRGSGNWNGRTEVFKLDIRGGYVPTLTVIDASAAESGDTDSTTTMTFLIFLDQQVKHAVSVSYATEDGTAKAGTNYNHTSGTVTFAPREQSQFVDVDILDDGAGGRTYFMLVLSNPKGAGLRNNAPGTGKIYGVSPRFRSWPESARESGNGNDTQMNFYVKIYNRDDDSTYTIDYATVNGAARAGSDYTATSDTLIFEPGDKSYQQVTVPILDDSIEDSGETFSFVLSNPTGGAELDRLYYKVNGTILNEDAPGVSASFPTTAHTSISHTGTDDRPKVVVAFSEPVATFNKNTASVHVANATVYSVAPHTEEGIANAYIFTLNPDGEGEITFALLSNADCGSGGICNSAGIKLIETPEILAITGPAAPRITSQLSVSDATASEEDDSTIDFVVTLNPASEESITVDYATSNGSATAGDDYTAKSGTLTFTAGQTSKTIQVSIIDDTIDDDNETFTLTLSSPNGAQISDATGTGTISNSEPVEDPPAQDPVVLLTASFANVPADHNGSNFTFQLSFSENVEAGYARIRDHAFTVTGATIDSASRITQGSNQGWNVEVNPTGNEAITITLPETTNCSDDEAICTDDERMLSHSTEERVEGPPAISVSDATVQEAEGATLEFSVTLSHASSRTVTVSYATQDGTAKAGPDYTATSATLTFNAGDLSQTVEVTVLTDSEDEGQETLTLTLSNPSQATLGDGTGTGTIENGESSSGTQEDPPVVLLTGSFSNMPATHNGSAFTFDLSFSENVKAGYARIRDHAFTISGTSTIVSAVRKTQGSNQNWTITVQPNGNDAITITLPPTTDCDADGAVCTAAGRKLSNRNEFTVSGPGG